MTVRIESRGLCVEAAADRFDLREGVETVGLGELFKDRRALLHPGIRRKAQRPADRGEGGHRCAESSTRGANEALCNLPHEYERHTFGLKLMELLGETACLISTMVS